MEPATILAIVFFTVAFISAQVAQMEFIESVVISLIFTGVTMLFVN